MARIDFLYLGPTPAGRARPGQSQDTIGGVLFVHGPRGSVAAETPLRAITSYFPIAVDNALIVQTNHNRVVALAQAFATWRQDSSACEAVGMPDHQATSNK